MILSLGKKSLVSWQEWLLLQRAGMLFWSPPACTVAVLFSLLFTVFSYWGYVLAVTHNRVTAVSAEYSFWSTAFWTAWHCRFNSSVHLAHSDQPTNSSRSYRLYYSICRRGWEVQPALYEHSSQKAKCELLKLSRRRNRAVTQLPANATAERKCRFISRKQWRLTATCGQRLVSADAGKTDWEGRWLRRLCWLKTFGRYRICSATRLPVLGWSARPPDSCKPSGKGAAAILWWTVSQGRVMLSLGRAPLHSFYWLMKSPFSLT